MGLHMSVWQVSRFWCSPCRNPAHCAEGDVHTHHLTWYGRLYFHWYPKLRVSHWLRGFAVVLTGFTVMACGAHNPPAPTVHTTPTSMTTTPLTSEPTVTVAPTPSSTQSQPGGCWGGTTYYPTCANGRG